MLLCRVALGNQKKLTSGDSTIGKKIKASNGEWDSCFYTGDSFTMPDPKLDQSKNGYTIPNGKAINNYGGCNMYIVYNTDQIKMEYLVEL